MTRLERPYTALQYPVTALVLIERTATVDAPQEYSPLVIPNTGPDSIDRSQFEVHCEVGPSFLILNFALIEADTSLAPIVQQEMAERPEAEAKRQKVSQRPQGGSVTRGRPDGREGKEKCFLVTMPLEILFEVRYSAARATCVLILTQILGLVSPGDLLNVSRTNRLFKTALMDPNEKRVWVASRSTLDAPEPPDDFTEVRWAKLLFHTNCQVGVLLAAAQAYIQSELFSFELVDRAVTGAMPIA